MVRSRYKLSLVFRLSPVCSKFKFKFLAGIQLFGMKTTLHDKSDHKMNFLGQVYKVKWFSGQKVEYPQTSSNIQVFKKAKYKILLVIKLLRNTTGHYL